MSSPSWCGGTGRDHRQDEPREHDRCAGVLAASDELTGRVLGRGERPLELDALDEEPGVRQDEPGAVGPKLDWDPLEPSCERLHLRGVEHPLGHRLEQLGGRLAVPGLQQVVDGLGHLAERPIGLSRAPMQRRGRRWIPRIEAGAQEGAEEVVVAVPLAVGVEPLCEDVPGDELSAQAGRVRGPGHRCGHVGGEAVEDGRLQEKPLGRCGLGLQDLVGQVVEQAGVVETPVHSPEALARLAAQDHARDPPLGDLMERAGPRALRVGGSASEQLRRLELGQREVGRPEDQPLHARVRRHAGRQGRPRRERQMHVRGEIARERRQCLLSGGRERVDVVQDERHVVRSGDHDLVAERLDLVDDLAIEIDARAETREALPERRAHMGEQPRTGESLVAGAPSRRDAQPRQRLRQQRRLPVAGARDHHDPSRLEALDQAPHQLLPVEVMRRKPRRPQPRQQYAASRHPSAVQAGL